MNSRSEITKTYFFFPEKYHRVYCIQKFEGQNRLVPRTHPPSSKAEAVLKIRPPLGGKSLRYDHFSIKYTVHWRLYPDDLAGLTLRGGNGLWVKIFMLFPNFKCYIISLWRPIFIRFFFLINAFKNGIIIKQRFHCLDTVTSVCE